MLLNLSINLTKFLIFLQPTGSHFVILHWALHSYKIWFKPYIAIKYGLNQKYKPKNWVKLVSNMRKYDTLNTLDKKNS